MAQRRWNVQPGMIVIEIPWREGDEVQKTLGTNIDAIAPAPRETVLVTSPLGMHEGRVLERHNTQDERVKRIILEIPQVCQPFISEGGSDISVHRVGKG